MSPTIKQKKAFKKVLKGSTISGAMKEVGYSDTTCTTTGKLTNTQGWQELMDKYLSEEDLAKVHKEGLKAVKITRSDKEEYIDPDYNTRHKYLETGYKLRKKYDDSGVQVNVLINKIYDETN